jgi:phosphatidylinositol-3-phosphatase
MRLRNWLAFGVCVLAMTVGHASESTVVLTGAAHVADVAIRGGSFAAVNAEGELLVTRGSTSLDYVRRSLLDFNVASIVPAGDVVASATLKMTVHWGGAEAAREVAVRPITRPFVAREATWDVASASTPWTKPGGDLGAEVTRAAVPNQPGSTASFDVTSLVRQALGSSGDHHARMALVDVGDLSTGREGYRDYYPTEATDAATRPALTITYGPATTTTGIPRFAHVFIIMMENKESSQVIGSSSAPFINHLASQYGSAANYTGVAHPSLPNYMAVTGGETVFTTDCSGCVTPAQHIADQVVVSGRHWKAYMESMPAPCTTTDSGLYAQKHNPFIHYTDVVGNATRCRNHVVPFTSFATDLKSTSLADYVWITPNLCHDMHDCSVATGDNWLSSVVPEITGSPAFANSVLFVLWDEGTTSTGGGGVVPAIVVSDLTKAGLKSTTAYNHYSVLRTIEDAWSLPRLGHAATAQPMGEFFKP